MKNKREVILEFNSSPDAILNALHQAGWQVIPKKDPDQSVWDYLDGKPQRSEQQEWTPQEILSWLRKGKPELVAEIERLNAALSAERQRREQAMNALEHIDTVALAVSGFTKVANAISEARVILQ